MRWRPAASFDPFGVYDAVTARIGIGVMDPIATVASFFDSFLILIAT